MPRVWMGMGGRLAPNDRLISYPGILRVEASKMATKTQVQRAFRGPSVTRQAARTLGLSEATADWLEQQVPDGKDGRLRAPLRQDIEGTR